MKWLYKLEYKYGRYAIRNMILFILVGQLAVFMLDMMFTFGISNALYLDMGLVIGKLQLWRLITFVFVPTNFSPVWIIISLMFYYFIAQSLENAWGSFMFNAYYIIGMIGIILGALIVYLITGYGYGTSEYLNTSMFLAFAILYPDLEVRLFFVLPVKSKYLGIISGVLIVVEVILSIASGRWYLAVSALMAIANLILFFWRDASKNIKSHFKYRKTRQNYNNQMREWERNKRDQDK